MTEDFSSDAERIFEQVPSQGLIDAAWATYHTIRQGVKEAVQGLRFTLPRVLRLPDTHPFATTVNARKLPCDPNAADNTVPYLAMEGLTDRLLDVENIVDAETVAWIANEEKRALHDMLDSPRVLCGISGGGKTRLICEMLAKEYGLLFVAHRRGTNVGCGDLEAALKPVERELERRKRERRDMWSGSERRPTSDDLQRNALLVKRHVLALVLARLVLLESLLEGYNDPTEFSPAMWLWMQLHPEHVFPSSPEFASLFQSLWKELLSLSDETFMMQRCEELTRNIRALENARRPHGIEATTTLATTAPEDGPRKLPCFVDEAQVLLQMAEYQFVSTTNPKIEQSAFYTVAKSFAEACKGPVMAGAGVPMAHAGGILLSDDGDENALHAVRTCHLEPEHCRQYINRYLNGIEDADLTRICNALQGRPRFAEQFVAQCIERGRDEYVMAIFDKFLTLQTTVQQPCTRSRLDSTPKLSAFHNIASSINEIGFMSALISHAGSRTRCGVAGWTFTLIQHLRRLTVGYALTGQVQIGPRKHQLDMLKHGLANIQQQEGYSFALIREPIVIRAASSYFGLAECMHSLLLGSQDSRGFLRSELPTYIALALFDGGGGPFLLGPDAPVNVNGDNLPPSFQGSWKLWLPRACKETGVVAASCYSDGELQKFLGCDPQFAMVFPDKSLGPDVLLRVHDSTDEGRRLMVAISNRDWETGRAGGRKRNARKRRSQERSDAGSQPSLPLLKIVVAFPATVENKPAVQLLSDQEMTLILDERNFERIIPKSVCVLLRHCFGCGEKKRGHQCSEAQSSSSTARKNARK